MARYPGTTAAKDISDQDLLDAVYVTQGRYKDPGALLSNFPPKVISAKLKKAERRGLITKAPNMGYYLTALGAQVRAER